MLLMGHRPIDPVHGGILTAKFCQCLDQEVHLSMGAQATQKRLPGAARAPWLLTMHMYAKTLMHHLLSGCLWWQQCTHQVLELNDPLVGGVAPKQGWATRQGGPKGGHALCSRVAAWHAQARGGQLYVQPSRCLQASH